MERELHFGDILFRYLPEAQVWHTGLVYNVPKYTCIHHGVDDCSICGIRKRRAGDVAVAEFDDSNMIRIVPLTEFMYGRKYFWVYNYSKEWDVHKTRAKEHADPMFKCGRCNNHGTASYIDCAYNKCRMCPECRRCTSCAKTFKMFRGSKNIRSTVNKLMDRQPLIYTLNNYNCEYFCRRSTLHDEQMHTSPQTVKILDSNALLATKLLSAAFIKITGGLGNNKEYESTHRPNDVKYYVNTDGHYIFEDTKANLDNAKKVHELRYLAKRL
jgi:hypothetical protein